MMTFGSACWILVQSSQAANPGWESENRKVKVSKYAGNKKISRYVSGAEKPNDIQIEYIEIVHRVRYFSV